MECCWAALVKRVEAAVDLDQVIDAHNQFLEKVTTQCLLDTQSQVYITYVYIHGSKGRGHVTKHTVNVLSKI